MSEGEVVLEFRNVSFRYLTGKDYALRNVSFKVKRGEFIGVIGATGAGKTTLCYCINGLIPHHIAGYMKGDVIVCGLRTRNHPPRDLAKKVAIVFDNPEYQLSQPTVMEEVALGLENLGVPREEILRRIEKALELVGLRGLEKRSPLALSGGQQQRLAIAAGLAMAPEIMVLDEPTSNLDPMGKDEVFEVVRKLNKERGMTVIMVENEIELLVEYADRLIVMDSGRIVLEGDPRKVFEDVERILSLRIKPPQVTELTHELIKKGVKLEGIALTVEEAYSYLKGIMEVGT